MRAAEYYYFMQMQISHRPQATTSDTRYVPSNGVDVGIVSANTSRSYSIRSPCWMRLIHIICTLMRRKCGSRRHIVVCGACIVFSSIYGVKLTSVSAVVYVETVNVKQRQNIAASVWVVEGFVDLLWTVDTFAESRAHFSLFCLMSTLDRNVGMCTGFMRLTVGTISHINCRNSLDNWNCSFIDSLKLSHAPWQPLWFDSDSKFKWNTRAKDWTRHFNRVQFTGIVGLECDGKNTWNYCFAVWKLKRLMSRWKWQKTYF